MTPAEMKKGSATFALDVIRFVRTLPQTTVAGVIGRQLVPAGTSVGANYRAACRARSNADFVNKMGIVEEEADESAYWLELLIAAEIVPRERVAALIDEPEEMVAMAVSSINTARGGNR